uniref:hypothetical protein n=1 Tax=Microbispora cellulosiformans TaxID=2614688 RepID=UPI001CDA50F3|nr:hypothetical protein [Microbispora cellulosiformans]
MSSRRTRTEFPELARHYYRANKLWPGSHFARSVDAHVHELPGAGRCQVPSVRAPGIARPVRSPRTARSGAPSTISTDRTAEQGTRRSPRSAPAFSAVLVEGEIIEIVAERKVRGTFERSYRLRTANATVTAEDAAGLGADDHRQAFMTFVASLLADFDRYLDRDDFDLGRDGVGYRQVAMYLSDEEFREFLQDLAAVLRPRLANQPAPGRVRRIHSTVVMPAQPPA